MPDPTISEEELEKIEIVITGVGLFSSSESKESFMLLASLLNAYRAQRDMIQKLEKSVEHFRCYKIQWQANEDKIVELEGTIQAQAQEIELYKRKYEELLHEQKCEDLR